VKGNFDGTRKGQDFDERESFSATFEIPTGSDSDA